MPQRDPHHSDRAYLSFRSRRPSTSVSIRGVPVGGAHPVVVQSMTNTDTADAAVDGGAGGGAGRAGSQIVRVTVNNDEAARRSPRSAAPRRIAVSTSRSSATSTTTATCCSRSTRSARGARQVPHQSRQRRRQAPRRELPTIVQVAVEHDKPVRIGVNWGSLDQDLLTQMMDENAARADAARREGRLHRGDARERAALGGAGRGGRARARPDHPQRQGLGGAGPRRVYRRLAARCDYPLHLGLTEAGMGTKGIVASERGARDPAGGGHRRHHPRLAHAQARTATAPRKCSSRSRSCSRSACAASRRR